MRRLSLQYWYFCFFFQGINSKIHSTAHIYRQSAFSEFCRTICLGWLYSMRLWDQWGIVTECGHWILSRVLCSDSNWNWSVRFLLTTSQCLHRSHLLGSDLWILSLAPTMEMKTDTLFPACAGDRSRACSSRAIRLGIWKCFRWCEWRYSSYSKFPETQGYPFVKLGKKGWKNSSSAGVEHDPRYSPELYVWWLSRFSELDRCKWCGTACICDESRNRSTVESESKHRKVVTSAVLQKRWQ